MTNIDAILDDLERFARPQRQDGDITRMDLMARGFSDGLARSMMKAAVDSGEYISLVVYDPGRRAEVRVIRRKAN